MDLNAYLQQRLSFKEQEITQLQSQIKKLERANRGTTEIIERTGQKLKENKSKRKALEAQLTDIQEQFQTNQIEIEQLKTEIKDKQALIETYSSNQELVNQF